MTMARRKRGSKGAEWRKRLGRHRRSGLTVARFCKRQGVSTASFYAWRKRLDGAEGAGEKRSPAFRPVRLTSAGAVMWVHLPGGVRLEAPMENVAGVRAVVGALMRQGPSGQAGGEQSASHGGL
jgi:hypothetical protein